MSSDENSQGSLMAMELYPGALDGITGQYIKDETYEVDPEEMVEFEKTFPYKEPVQSSLHGMAWMSSCWRKSTGYCRSWSVFENCFLTAVRHNLW